MSEQHPVPDAVPDSWDQESESYEDTHEHLSIDENRDQDYVDEVGENEEDEDEEEEEEEEDDDHDDYDEEYMDAQDGAFELEVMIEAVSGDEGADGNDEDDDDAAGNPLHGRILRLLASERHDLFLEQIRPRWACSCRMTAANPERQGRTGRPGLTPQILALIRGQYPRQGMFDDDDDDDYDDDGDYPWGRRRTRPREPLDPDRFPKVPSEEGRKLMESGNFGAFDAREPDTDTKRLARRILDRELGLGSRAGRKATHNPMAQQMIPSTTPEMIIHYDQPVCCGQFSDDGNFFYACVKDYRVRLYDTSNPYNWRHYKTVTYPFGRWTLTDAALSPDNRWLAFTSLQSSVCFAPTDPNDTGDPYSLELSSTNHQMGFRGSFSIFSVRFSGDGRNLVAGTGAESIVVYDIERRQTVHHVRGHDDDVNAVCFADKMSPHILYSGSDDCTIKVWDTRSLGDGREAGAFVGHVEGITYIDSKGDGRYILSNGKDQSMKLWDLRMAMSSSDYERKDAAKPTRTRRSHYDYRGRRYPERRWFKHPHDNSLVTFRGHQVQGTLIRCHFSPAGSTDSRYVYSGSYDGFVYVWNMDATLKAKIDVNGATENVRPGWPNGRVTLVRDVGWHPNAPLLVASAWQGYDAEAGTASLHSFNENDVDEAEPGMGLSVDEKLAPAELSY